MSELMNKLDALRKDVNDDNRPAVVMVDRKAYLSNHPELRTVKPGIADFLRKDIANEPR